MCMTYKKNGEELELELEGFMVEERAERSRQRRRMTEREYEIE